MITFRGILSAIERKGMRFFTAGDYNLNLVGIRNKETSTNTFNDTLCVLFYQDDRPTMVTMPFTADPGRHYLKNPLVESGTAILKPGQYRGMWKLGLHKGKYRALVQRGPCDVYRDDNRDSVGDLDEASVERGLFGINCHKTHRSADVISVDRWSAGCQVVQGHNDYNILVSLCDKAVAIWGDGFTYTLLLEGDI